MELKLISIKIIGTTPKKGAKRQAAFWKLLIIGNFPNKFQGTILLESKIKTTSTLIQGSNCLNFWRLNLKITINNKIIESQEIVDLVFQREVQKIFQRLRLSTCPNPNGDNNPVCVIFISRYKIGAQRIIVSPAAIIKLSQAK